MLRHVALAVMAAASFPGMVSAAFFETFVPPKPGEKYKFAEYRMWLHEGVKTVRVVIMKQHGCGRKGITHANDLQWQALAAKWDAALIGSTLQPGSSNCSDWYEPENGSGRAFAGALSQLAGLSQHPELEEAPWVLWGHSGGAHWAVFMAEKHPTRVVAVFAQSGGMAGRSSAATAVPILFNRGAKDIPGITLGVDASFLRHRAGGAPWGLCINPVAQHECGNSRQLAIPYFDELLQLRLPGIEGRELRPLDATQGWLGDLNTLAIAPQAEFRRERSAAAWLPSEEVARLWKEFVEHGSIRDTTPPPRPSGLQARLDGQTVRLRWNAAADMESGIKSFDVFRDGRKIGSSPQSNGLFQQGNYGDEPEPVIPEMAYADDEPPKGRHSYQVSTINRAGLESPRSEGARVRVPARR